MFNRSESSLIIARIRWLGRHEITNERDYANRGL